MVGLGNTGSRLAASGSVPPSSFCSQGGVRGLNLQISTVSYCQEGISFDTTTTTPRTISNVVVGHVAAAQVRLDDPSQGQRRAPGQGGMRSLNLRLQVLDTPAHARISPLEIAATSHPPPAPSPLVHQQAQSNQHSVTFRAASSSDTFSNVNVNVNFVLTSGLTYPSLTASGLGFFGVPGTLSSTTVTFQAYDPAQFLTVTQASTVNNYASAAVQGVRFSVDTWLGGLVTPGNMITGAYK